MTGGINQVDEERVGFFSLLGDVGLVLLRQGVEEGDSPESRQSFCYYYY